MPASSRAPALVVALVTALVTLILVAPPTGSAATAAPANDRFEDAQALDGAAVTGTTDGATADPGTPGTALPSHADTSVWYRWVAPTDGQYLFTATRDGEPTDTVLRAFEGTDLILLRRLAENDDADPDGETSQVGINAVTGQTYYLLVDATSTSTTGSFTLTWEAFEDAAPTATTLTAVGGQRVVTLDVAVDVLASATDPSGYLEVFDGSTRLAGLGRVDVNASTVQFRLGLDAAPGRHTYRARFVPDSYLLAQSTSPTRAATVSKLSTTTWLQVPARVRAGALPVVTARVHSLHGDSLFGQVRFMLDGRVLRTVPLTSVRNPVGARYRASVKLPPLRAGTARVVARYLGAPTVLPSQRTRSIVVRR